MQDISKLMQDIELIWKLINITFITLLNNLSRQSDLTQEAGLAQKDSYISTA